MEPYVPFELYQSYRNRYQLHLVARFGRYQCGVRLFLVFYFTNHIQVTFSFRSEFRNVFDNRNLAMMAYISSNGDIDVSPVGQLAVQCDLNLKYFPFDEQVLNCYLLAICDFKIKMIL